MGYGMGSTWVILHVRRILGASDIGHSGKRSQSIHIMDAWYLCPLSSFFPIRMEYLIWDGTIVATLLIPSGIVVRET